MQRGGFFESCSRLFDKRFEQAFTVSSLSCPDVEIRFAKPLIINVAWIPTHGIIVGRWYLSCEFTSASGAVFDQAWELFCALMQEAFSEAQEIVRQLRSNDTIPPNLTVDVAQQALRFVSAVKPGTKATKARS